MNKSLKKILVTGASLLMMASVGISGITVSANRFQEVKYEKEAPGRHGYEPVFNRGKGAVDDIGDTHHAHNLTKSQAERYNYEHYHHSYRVRHHHMNRTAYRIAIWYRNHTLRNRVHYAASNSISSRHYQEAFDDDPEDDAGIGVTNNFHALLKGINSTNEYKISKMIPSTSGFQAKYLKYLSGDYNGNDSDVYAIKYRGHKYYYADNLSNNGSEDPLQSYSASYDDGSIDSNVRPNSSSAYLKHGQHLHRGVEWYYENPKSYSATYYKYTNGAWREDAGMSDNVPDYVQDN